MQKSVKPLNAKTKPLEYIDWLYAHTYYKNGSIYISDLGYTEIDRGSIRCILKWNENDLKCIKRKYSNLLNNIEKVANIYKEVLNPSNFDIEQIMNSNGLLDFWEKFFRSFNYEEASLDKIDEIGETMKTIKEIQKIEHNLWTTRPITLYEQKLYNNYKNLKVSDEELKLYTGYWNSFKKYCENKVGEAPFAMDLVLRARRVCKILEIEAPEIIILHEERALAAALVIHNYAADAEFVDRTACLNEINADFFERDEEKDKKYLDYLYLLI